MWARFKSYVAPAATIFKSYVAPVVVSAGTILSAAGKALFFGPKVFKWFAGEADHPGATYLSAVNVATTVIANAATRVPNTFKTFNTPPPSINQPLSPPGMVNSLIMP